VACNLAFALGGYYPGQVVLGELGNCVPEMSLNLDLQPRHGLDALAAAWERMDALLLRKALVTHPSHVSVLAYPPDTLQPVSFTPSIMRNILILLRSMFNFTVVDLGHVLDDTRTEALSLTDKIVVVVRLDVPSLRLTRQFIHRLEDLGIGQEKLCIIVNRFGQRKQFSWRKAKEVLGLTISEWIPDDPGTVNLSINHGQPLIQIAKRASITRRFSSLAKQLNGRANGTNRH
jgi:pilus assembly protein CpaE